LGLARGIIVVKEMESTIDLKVRQGHLEPEKVIGLVKL
jgi:hypothetical protein